MPADSHNPLAHLTLGQSTDYVSNYQPTLLQAVPRALNRRPIGIDDTALPFQGEDVWTGYEISWLNSNGLPQVAIGVFRVPATSANLIESKSFKLYLNSFNQSRFSTWQAVIDCMRKDLSQTAGESVEVMLYRLSDFTRQHPIAEPRGTSLDSLDVMIEHYDYCPSLLAKESEEIVTEHLYTDLLKSNCLITNQPDWGSLQVTYRGPKIDHKALLKYVVSFRNHNEFHEQCVERIFQDLMAHCGCEQLTVSARYTRRGGLDINPIRSSHADYDVTARTVRQ